ncbi:MAG: hypothetical protein ABIJ31_13710 [Pseudomonadota bacterium]
MKIIYVSRQFVFFLLMSMALMVSSPGWAAAIKPVAVQGQGEYFNSETLLIDGFMPAQEAAFDDPACVSWFGPGVSFVIDLGAVYRIEAITLQADNNDDYSIEGSIDGNDFTPALTLGGDMGEIDGGMETVSTDKHNPQFLPELTLIPAKARYLRLTAGGGDEVYAVSEVMVSGTKLTGSDPAPAQAADAPVNVLPQTAEKPSGVPAQTNGDMEKIFNAMDTNHDNRVSKKEYAAMWKNKLDVDKNFSFFDRDGTGFIEREEYLGLADLKNRPSGKNGQPSSTLQPEPVAQMPDQAASSESETLPPALQGGISMQLDPTRVKNALAALKEWKSATDAMAAGKLKVMDQYVNKYHFENWFDLNFYMNQVCVIGAELRDNPAARGHLINTYGKEAVDIIGKPASQEQIKKHCRN